ncbi:MAG: sel1 repeat family protein [Prevotella sp.]|nr:sel1 repeat family protein [Prevotella sp.]
MKTRLFLLIALMMVTSVAMGQAVKRRQRGVQQTTTTSSQQPVQAQQQSVQAQQPTSNTPPPSSAGEIEKQEQYDQYIAAAKAGDAVAEERVANSHKFPSKGYLYWLTRSAEHGYQGAQNVLAYCYYNGYGVENDKKKAFYWWLKSAEQGNAASQRSVGDMYLAGSGTEKNEEKAYYWFQKGAEQNEPHCLVMMGYAYEGKGIIPADPVKSFNCFKKAADMEYDTAMPQVAFRYFYGDGVAQDYGQAVYWFEKIIARGGDPEDVEYWKELSAKAKMRQQIKNKQKK